MTDKKTEALKLALVAERVLKAWDDPQGMPALCEEMSCLREALAEQPAQQEPVAWRELCRRLYVELYWCDRQMMQTLDENGEPMWTQGKTVRDVLADAKAALETSPQPAQQQEPVTVLPDGSAFAVMSYPLPKDHWLYADRQYNDGEYEPVELGKPVLTHELRDAVVSAVRYAIRGATNCGKEVDFDPDALVQNAVYALCGPFTPPPASKPRE